MIFLRLVIFIFFFLVSNSLFAAILSTKTLDGHSYQLIGTKKSYIEAKNNALYQGGYLASINSEEENSIMIDMLSAIDQNYNIVADGGNASYVWLGASDSQTEGVWLWEDDSSVNDYSNWGNLEPDNNNNQDGLAIALGNWSGGIKGQWNDINVTNSLYFIIEYDDLLDCSNFRPPTIENLNAIPFLEDVARPGINCKYYANNVSMPPCGLLSGVIRNPRINCMDLKDLPSCDILEKNHVAWEDNGSIGNEPREARYLRNCIRIGNGQDDISSQENDICVEGDGKIEGVNCVKFCYTENSDLPTGCSNRMYHHYSSNDINIRVNSRNDVNLQYGCRKLISDELLFFNDEFTFQDCRDLRQIEADGTIGVKKIDLQDGNGPQPIDVILNKNIGELHTTCRYPKCQTDFQSVSKAINQEVQRDQDNRDPDDSTKFIALKNCFSSTDLQVLNKSFIAADKIVCSSKNEDDTPQMCYDFTEGHMDYLISSVDRLEKCMSLASDDRSKANCFLYISRERMCQIHRSLGENCNMACSDLPANERRVGENCFYSRCSDLPPNDRRIGENCFDYHCSNMPSDTPADFKSNCYNDSSAIIPGVNCNFHDITLPINYTFDNASDIEALDVNDAYRNKFFKRSNTLLSYNNLRFTNLAISNNFPAGGGSKFPDYLKQNICNSEDVQCLLPFADDCNYPSPTNQSFGQYCNLRYGNTPTPTKSTDFDDGMNLDQKNLIIEMDANYDRDNDWFYKPYPLFVGEGISGNGIPYRIPYGDQSSETNPADSYNGSVFDDYGQSQDVITPRNNQYSVIDDESTRGDAHFYRLCYDFDHLKELDILDEGSLWLGTIATAAAAGLAVLFGPISVAAGAIAGAAGADFFVNRYISPSQCSASMFRQVLLDDLESSSVYGYKGSTSEDDHKEDYAFQYDIVPINDFPESYKFLLDEVYGGAANSNYFKQEFYSDEDFSSDIMFDNNGIKDIDKIVVARDAYVRGGIVTINSRSGIKYKVKACMRFGGGARSCKVKCNAFFCHEQECGRDKCVDLYVSESSGYECSVAHKLDDGTLEHKNKSEFNLDNKECAKVVSDNVWGVDWLANRGEVRLRAVSYPGRYICIFADAKHGSTVGDDDGDGWRARSLVSSVSRPYRTLDHFNNGRKRDWVQKYCLRYPIKIDYVSRQNMDDCENSVESQSSCIPLAHYGSGTKDGIDYFINNNTDNLSFSVNDHKGAKRDFFHNFEEYILFNESTDTDQQVLMTDFFTPTILVRYGSELAASSLKTGCLGDAEGVSINMITKCQSDTYPQSFPDFSVMSLDNVNDNLCRQHDPNGNVGCNRRNLKTSDDGIFRLKSNQRNDFEGVNYSNFLYMEKEISNGVPIVKLKDGEGNNIKGRVILRKLPNYDNIVLDYNNSQGKFIIKLKDNANPPKELSPVNLTIANQSDPTLPNSLEWITGYRSSDLGTCFDNSLEYNKVNLENMRFCLKRDECSLLFAECIENNLISATQDDRTNLWNECFANTNLSLIKRCSKKWNITHANDEVIIEDIIDIMEKHRNDDSSIADNKYYGWHHEVCLDNKSYNEVRVAQHLVGDESVQGKCILDPVIHGNVTINSNGQVVANGAFAYNDSCRSGGNEAVKNTDGTSRNPCYCLKISDPLYSEKIAATGLVDIGIRNATARELGLCFDKALPLSCNSNIRMEGDDYDRYRKRTSLNLNTYHAEYDRVFLPFSQFNYGAVVYGKCNENWMVNNQGRPPSMLCKANDSYDVANFTQHEIEIIFNNSCVGGQSLSDQNCVQDDDITISNNNPKTIFLFDLDENKIFKDSQGRNLDILTNLFKSGDSILLKSTNNPDITAKIIDSKNEFIQVGNFNPPISSDVILTSIRYSRSANTFCSRPKCSVRSGGEQLYSINKYSSSGGRYQNPIYTKRSSSNDDLDQKGREHGYSYWQSDQSLTSEIIAGLNPNDVSSDFIDGTDPNDVPLSDKDINIYVDATGCLDGFTPSPAGLPRKICTPEGNVTVVMNGDDVVNSCIRSECNLLPFSTINDPNFVVSQLKGVDFRDKNLDVSSLKTSRSRSNSLYDVKVTKENERSVVVGKCYNSLEQGLMYTHVGNGDQMPYLACNYDRNEQNKNLNLEYNGTTNFNPRLMNSDLCVPANCNAIIVPDLISLDPSRFVYRQITGYNQGYAGVYSRSQSNCNEVGNKSFKNYPYHIEMLHNTSRLDETSGTNQLTDDFDQNDYLYNMNGKRMIKANSRPIKHCYITNESLVAGGSNDPRPARPDNPCISGCIGARDFRDNFGNIEYNLISASNIEYNDIRATITIDQILKNNPPYKIIFANSELILHEHASDIFVSYPTQPDDVAQETKIVINLQDESGNEIFPNSVILSSIEIELVNRVNTGITRHYVSTRDDDIIIEWPNVNFGNKQYAFFDDTSTNILNPSSGKHYKIYCGESGCCNGRSECSDEDIRFSDNMPNGYFASDRNDGKFLLARKCNDNGIWSEVEKSINQNNIESYQDPNNAYTKVTPLCAFKGDIATGLIVNGTYPMHVNKIASSHNYLSNMSSGDSSEKDRIREGIENVDLSSAITIDHPNIIDTKDGYSLADRDSNLPPYSMQKCKYSNGHQGKIDKLSLYEYDTNDDSDPFSGLVVAASAKKYCSPEELPSNIGDSTRSTTNQIFFVSEKVAYDLCAADKFTKIGNIDPYKTCTQEGSWGGDNDNINDNCKVQCNISKLYRTDFVYSGKHAQVTLWPSTGATILEGETVGAKFVSKYEGEGKWSHFDIGCNSDGVVTSNVYTSHDEDLGDHGCDRWGDDRGNIDFCGTRWCINNDRGRFFVNDRNPGSSGNLELTWRGYNGDTLNDIRIDGSHNCRW